MRRLFLAAPILAALVVAAAVAPTSAEIYDNTTIPIYVAAPDSFTISRSVREGYDLALHINPVGDFPSRVAASPVCAASTSRRRRPARPSNGSIPAGRTRRRWRRRGA